MKLGLHTYTLHLWGLGQNWGIQADPRPIYGSCFHPQVMRQLCDAHDEIKIVLPLLEKTGIKLAVENHTETFADEILWVIHQVNHPLVGACVDTVNSMGVLENPEQAVQKLAPYAFCNHFCDHKLTRDQFGIRFHGVALGDGYIGIINLYLVFKGCGFKIGFCIPVTGFKGEHVIDFAARHQCVSDSVIVKDPVA
jgi:sugar phosphate isomerase/epimerase